VHEIKSAIILQPGPAALTDGLDALHATISQWATKASGTRSTAKQQVTR
jgi:iron complex transport system substrate-binding protein